VPHYRSAQRGKRGLDAERRGKNSNSSALVGVKSAKVCAVASGSEAPMIVPYE